MLAAHACIGLWHHRPLHALTAWDLKFQVCLGYTFTPATLSASVQSKNNAWQTQNISFPWHRYLLRMNILNLWCHDVQHNDNQRNDSQHNYNQQNDTLNNYTQNNNNKICHLVQWRLMRMPSVIKLSVFYGVSFMLSVFYAECLLCWVYFMLIVFYAECQN